MISCFIRCLYISIIGLKLAKILVSSLSGQNGVFNAPKLYFVSMAPFGIALTSKVVEASMLGTKGARCICIRLEYVFVSNLIEWHVHGGPWDETQKTANRSGTFGDRVHAGLDGRSVN